jgi:hypothetical protein
MIIKKGIDLIMGHVMDANEAEALRLKLNGKLYYYEIKLDSKNNTEFTEIEYNVLTVGIKYIKLFKAIGEVVNNKKETYTTLSPDKINKICVTVDKMYTYSSCKCTKELVLKNFERDANIRYSKKLKELNSCKKLIDMVESELYNENK